MKKFIIGMLAVSTALLGFGVSAANAGENAGDDAVVEATVEANVVTVVSTKDLSNVHIVLCAGTVIKFDDEDLTGKEADLEVDGDVRAVFVHSGNNTTLSAEVLLALLGGVINGNSTGALAYEGDCDTEPESVSLSVCLSGVVSVFGPGVLEDVQAEVDAFLEANPDATILGEDDTCDAPEEETTTTTTTVVEENPGTPLTLTGTPVVPVVEEAPLTATPAAPVALPHTV